MPDTEKEKTPVAEPETEIGAVAGLENKPGKPNTDAQKPPQKSNMLLRLLTMLILVPAGSIIGWLGASTVLSSYYAEFAAAEKGYAFLICLAAAIVFGSVMLAVAMPIFEGLKKLYYHAETKLVKYTGKEILFGILGFTLGLIITLVLYLLLLSPFVGELVVQLVIVVIIGALVCSLLTMLFARKVSSIVSFPPAGNIKARSEGAPEPHTAASVVDASSLIDGRVLDIVRTGFISGLVVVPEIVLKELSSVADSPDVLKRNRGRRGLDILKEMQKERGVSVKIFNDAGSAGKSADERILTAAEAVSGRLITLDQNLSKLAQVKHISVLNINELSQAIKPIALPGERLTTLIVKEGKEYGQGVAYMDDGTMIVVENGGGYIGETVEITITTAFQTAAGRMIFARVI